MLEYSFGIWQGPLNLIEYFERQSSNMPVCFEIWALTDIDKAQVWCIWCVLQYLTSQWYFDLVNPVWFPEVFSISSPFLKRKKSTHTFTSYIYRILFHYVANNDIQIYWYTTFTVRVCAFVSVCVCKESSETTESRMKIPCEGALNGLTRQR